jgi:hypothetical protein
VTLHEAVARAIAPHLESAFIAGVGGYPRIDGADLDAAAAAVGVCLAEAQRAIARVPIPSNGPLHQVERSAALAVLAALAEEQA